MNESLSTDTVAGLIDAAGARRSLDLLFEALARAVPFEMVSVLVYRGRGRPVALYDTFDTVEYRKGLDNYLRSSYVLNPCYQAYLGGLRSGVMRIRDLVTAGNARLPEGGPVMLSAEEEIGYVTLGWPPNREELLLVAPLPNDEVAEVGFLRARSKGGFSDAHVERLRQIHPVVTAVIRRYWQKQADAGEPDSRIDTAFENFGKAQLSARERDVVRFVLQGHSSESIGLHLGISVTTVKTHRKNAYAKLDISTQSELLSLFLKTLDRG
jgi:DNA-binding CsgD family transcriptional regulator